MQFTDLWIHSCQRCVFLFLVFCLHFSGLFFSQYFWEQCERWGLEGHEEAREREAVRVGREGGKGMIVIERGLEGVTESARARGGVGSAGRGLGEGRAG